MKPLSLIAAVGALVLVAAPAHAQEDVTATLMNGLADGFAPAVLTIVGIVVALFLASVIVGVVIRWREHRPRGWTLDEP